VCTLERHFSAIDSKTKTVSLASLKDPTTNLIKHL